MEEEEEEGEEEGKRLQWHLRGMEKKVKTERGRGGGRGKGGRREEGGRREGGGREERREGVEGEKPSLVKRLWVSLLWDQTHGCKSVDQEVILSVVWCSVFFPLCKHHKL